MKRSRRPKATLLRPFIQALHSILRGSRDCTLANSPDLDYSMAAEILLLIDKLST